MSNNLIKVWELVKINLSEDEIKSLLLPELDGKSAAIMFTHLERNEMLGSLSIEISLPSTGSRFSFDFPVLIQGKYQVPPGSYVKGTLHFSSNENQLYLNPDYNWIEHTKSYFFDRETSFFIKPSNLGVKKEEDFFKKLNRLLKNYSDIHGSHILDGKDPKNNLLQNGLKKEEESSSLHKEHSSSTSLSSLIEQASDHRSSQDETADNYYEDQEDDSNERDGANGDFYENNVSDDNDSNSNDLTDSKYEESKFGSYSPDNDEFNSDESTNDEPEEEESKDDESKDNESEDDESEEKEHNDDESEDDESEEEFEDNESEEEESENSLFEDDESIEEEFEDNEFDSNELEEDELLDNEVEDEEQEQRITHEIDDMLSYNRGTLISVLSQDSIKLREIAKKQISAPSRITSYTVSIDKVDSKSLLKKAASAKKKINALNSDFKGSKLVSIKSRIYIEEIPAFNFFLTPIEANKAADINDHLIKDIRDRVDEELWKLCNPNVLFRVDSSSLESFPIISISIAENDNSLTLGCIECSSIPTEEGLKNFFDKNPKIAQCFRNCSHSIVRNRIFFTN